MQHSICFWMFLLLCAPIPFDFECFCLCMPQVAFDCLWKCILHMVCGCFGLCWCHAFFHFDFRKARFGWLVLVCVCGVVFVVLGPLSACSAPMVLARSLGKCLLLVSLAFSSFLLGSLWAILFGILTCQTPCVTCMDFVGGGHGARAPNFPTRFPHQILHAQPPFQNNENIPFLCLGGGWLRIGIV